MKKVAVSIFVVFAVFGLVLSAFAGDSLFCGSRMLEIGDTKEDMIDKCGVPVSAETVGHDYSGGKKQQLDIDQYIYGPWTGMYYIVMVTGGRVTSINEKLE